MREFVCEDCGALIECFIDVETTEVDCKCGSMAQRIVGMPTVKLDGTDPGFPGAYDRWARIREENAKIKAKKNS
jgi:DNA-directed RNA polymerase subunit RPC12/RpoP